MKNNKIEWVFFDIGSTLVDENRACLHRLHDLADAKRLGMKTVRVKQGYAKYWTVKSQDEQADFEVDDLSEIPGLI